MKRLLVLFIVILFTSITSFSQDKGKFKSDSYRMGNITAEDFKPTAYEIDSSASAVVIADIGSTEFVGNNSASFSLLFKRFRRARVLNKSGYDIGNVEISLYSNGDAEEELENLKAVCYNLENGKVVETKLEGKSGVFKDKINKNLVIKKFTFPNMKEGSIIEFEYKIKSDFFFNLQPWEFQGEYPCLWSEYKVAMPSFYSYVTLTQGYHPYLIKEVKQSRGNFNMADIRTSGATERANFSAQVTDYRWVMKDIPALKEESYTSTLNNHISRIEFQLSSIGEPFQYQKVMASWDMAAKALMEDEDFGAQLKKDNGWLNDVMSLAINKATTDLDKTRNIFAWVRDNFTCTNYSRKYLEQPLKNVLKNKTGNVAEINLMLIAMLRKAGIKADPMILSTRSHGYTNALYPLMDQFNYLVCDVEIDGNETFLDASRPGLGFGRLGYQCFNGHARVIGESARAIELDPVSVKEIKNTLVFMINDETGKYLASYQQTPGYFESFDLREEIREKGKEQVFAGIRKGMGDDFIASNITIDSLNKFDEPLGIKYDIEVKNHGEDIIYFNPLLTEGFKENPFKSAKRFYPVEMPYTIDETYTLQMEIPAGYVIDELPKGMLIKFNEEDHASYEYRISTSGSSISFRSRLQIKKTYFEPGEYEVLREFFSMIVKKQAEQIVFKKKTNP